MDVTALVLDLYARTPPLAEAAVAGLDTEALTTAPRSGANPIGWLVWNIARIQDRQFTEWLGTDQIWTATDWPARFGLDADADDTGYGHTPEQVAAVRPDGPDALLGYLGAVDSRVRAYLGTLGEADLDEIIDRSFDPPVSRGVRIVSIADDSLQHVGQAAYLRGLLDR
jgi:hypothetical protein